MSRYNSSMDILLIVYLVGVFASYLHFTNNHGYKSPEDEFFTLLAAISWPISLWFYNY